MISQHEARLVQQASQFQAQLAAAGEREQQLAAEVARCRELLEQLQGLPPPAELADDDLAVTAEGADEPLGIQPSSEVAEEEAEQAAAAALLPPGLPAAGFALFEAPAAALAFTSPAASGRGRASGRQRLASGRASGRSSIRHKTLSSRPDPAGSGGGACTSGDAAPAEQGQEWGQQPGPRQGRGSAAAQAESEDWVRGLFGMFGAGGSSGSGADGVAVGDTSLLQAGPVLSGGSGASRGDSRLGEPARN
jgi:hypothetical protein